MDCQFTMALFKSVNMTPSHLYSKWRTWFMLSVECGMLQRCLGGGSRQFAPATELAGNPTDRPSVGDRKEWKSKESFFFLLKCFNCVNFLLKRKKKKTSRVLFWNCESSLKREWDIYHRVLFQASVQAHDSSFSSRFQKESKKRKKWKEVGFCFGTASHL